MIKLRHLSLFVLGAIFLCLLSSRLESSPAVLWDEGWTASVARNRVEFGHYGRLSRGKPTFPGLEATCPVTGAVALAYRCIGIGLLRARLVIGIYFGAALLL